MKHKFKLLAGVALVFAGLPVTSGFGELQSVTHSDSAQGDLLDMPQILFEIGENSDGGGPGGFGFGPAFQITADYLGIGGVSDPATDGAGPNVRIGITNISLNAWTDLWYVADFESSISNVDGLVGTNPNAPSLFTFKIDAIGINTPLLSESMNVDGIFEIGETWEFVLQDFTGVINPGLMQSQGLGDGFSGLGSDPSAGSILAIPQGELVPEPSRALLLLVGLITMVATRRRA